VVSLVSDPGSTELGVDGLATAADGAPLQILPEAELAQRAELNRLAAAPELGPRLLFFSGGSALSGLSTLLKQYTHNSIHLITPFDSGGSSAELRAAFDMPGFGDLRSRLTALVSDNLEGSSEVCALFEHRLPREAHTKALQGTLLALVQGDHPLLAGIPAALKLPISQSLRRLVDQLPPSFDLQGASIGNLILAGAYIQHGHSLNQTLKFFVDLLKVEGTVRAIVDKTLHLAATLDNGNLLVGQHQLTGKERPPITAPIASLFLTERVVDPLPASVELPVENVDLIASAQLLCYAPGSFYSSLMANFLPQGVASAIAGNPCPKVWLPNLGVDPEQLHLSFDAVLKTLLAQLMSGGETKSPSAVLTHVLVDSRNGDYAFPICSELFETAGIELVDIPLVTDRSAPYYDDRLLLNALLSLV